MRQPASKLPPIDEVAVERVTTQINNLVGLGTVKKEVNDLITDAFNDRQREERGRPVESRTMHLVFEGPPGTGKTTVAKQIGLLYKALGLLPKGHVVEAKVPDLIASYSGQTPEKVRKKFSEARGGVLFIDEAYGLVTGDKDQYGQQAMTTLVDLMESHRDDTVVILAGYPHEMKELLHSNPGLPSRFPTTLHFEPYSNKELVQIFGRFAGPNQYALAPDAKGTLNAAVNEVGTASAGNAREVRNLYDKVKRQNAARNAVKGMSSGKTPSGHELDLFTKADVERGLAAWRAGFTPPAKQHQGRAERSRKGTLVAR